MPFPSIRDTAMPSDGVMLAVYAPFGSDEVLSHFPDPTAPIKLDQHPLLAALRGVAQAGTHVMALIDRVDEPTWLVDIPAGQPDAAKFTPRWKQDMTSEHTLAGFLLHAHERQPKAAMVLSLEGHGAGYLPDIDRRKLTWSDVTNKGQFDWQFSDTDAAPVDDQGNPVLPAGYPGLPAGYPGLPVNHAYMSTYRLGQALRLALSQGCPRLSVLHLNNCFNMSTEVLHTVAPYAQVATGHCNYNFFTASASFPQVFQRLQSQGSATALELGQWFVDEQHTDLVAVGQHPIIAGVVELSRMEAVAQGIDRLSDALLDAMRGAAPGDRPAVLDMIQLAIERAQQYDSQPGWQLETPDQLTDICSFAAALGQTATAHPAVQSAAWALVKLLDGIKRHGDKDIPWLDDTGLIVWDFSEKTLAMNIFLPDPLRKGQWDWRSTYYVDVNPDPSKPLVQPGVIEFLKATNWVEFLVEYHRDVPFTSFHVGSIPQLPPFNPGIGGGGGKPGGTGLGTLPPCTKQRWPLGRIGKRVADWLRAAGRPAPPP